MPAESHPSVILQLIQGKAGHVQSKFEESQLQSELALGPNKEMLQYKPNSNRPRLILQEGRRSVQVSGQVSNELGCIWKMTPAIVPILHSVGMCVPVAERT